MLILVLVLVLKDSLRTFFKSLSLSWSLGVRSLSLFLSLGVRVQEVLVLILVLVFSPYKDLFPLFHYSDLIIIYYIVLSTHTISFNYTYLCLFCRHLALRLYISYLWSFRFLLMKI